MQINPETLLLAIVLKTKGRDYFKRIQVPVLVYCTMAKRRKTKLSSKIQRHKNKARYRTNTVLIRSKSSKNYEINKTVKIQSSLAYKERAKRTNKRRSRRLACTHSKRLYTKKPEVKKTYYRSKYAQNKRSEKRRFSLYYRKLKTNCALLEETNMP